MKSKIIGMTLGIALLVLLIISGAFISSEYFNKKTTLTEFGLALTRILAVNSTAAVAFQDPDTATEILSALKEEPAALSAIVVDVHNQQLAYYISGAETTDDMKSIFKPTDLRPISFNRVVFDKNYFTVYQVIQEDIHLIGYIAVKFSLAKLYQSQRELMYIAAISAFVALILAFFFTTKLQKPISYPLETLANTMAYITTKEDYSSRATKYSNDELGKLTDSFNTMLVQIQSREAQLNKAKRQAESANEAKTTFLSRMSHELRTPLNAIIGFSSLIEMRFDENTRQQDIEAIEYILSAGKHLLVLINDIMDIVKFEQSDIDIELETVSLNKVLQETISLIATQAEQNNISVKIQETSLHIRANHNRLKQVIINLLTNAIKYNKTSGNVRVHFRTLDNNNVDIMVEDTGVGIDIADHEAIFDPFTRLPYAEHHEIQGTGIGLALSKFLVQQMNGQISLQSTVGVGTTFHLTFEQVALENTEQASPITSHQYAVDNQNTNKVLYIEDNHASRVLLENLLQAHANINILTASSAEKGIEIAKKESPHLIFIDINLPKMNGIEAIKILKNLEQLKECKFYALSADALPHQIDKALAAGFTDYLTKPLDVKKLFAVLAQSKLIDE